jgi:ABC-type branched-subunit amino acid transport system ATPase component
MIHQLIVDGFRGFQRFEVGGLGRVNLLVGTNNCGKTSILEAVQIFGSSGDPSSLWQVTSRRGERVDTTDSRRVVSPEADICHLFYGHEIDVGSTFRIVANTNVAEETLTATVAERSRQRQLFEEPGTGSDEDDVVQDPNWMLEFDWSGVPTNATRLPLSMRGGITSDSLRRYPRPLANGSARVSFISTSGLMVHDVVSMFEEIVLTREEDLVIQALSTIEPTIERLASVSSDRRRGYPGERGGIVVKCKDSSQRIPIGSMGDGMWRMLGLALAIVSAENSILLVDEIDTGLHFTVLEKMWRLVDEASRRLNVQVFATTHSRDAYESLAAISRDSISDGSEVTIQRIDRFRSKSVAFTEQEIVASAERGTEVR